MKMKVSCGMFGFSSDRSKPPWISAPNSTDDRKMPTGCWRPISAMAMPTKPAPAGKFSDR